MKKFIITTGIIFAILLIAGYFAYFPFMKWKLRKNINKVAIEYVSDILLINDYDSIKINKIDSISDLGYAKLTLELLEEMKVDYDYQYQGALMNGESDQTLNLIMEQSNDVEIAIAEQYNIANDENTISNNLRNYMVSATCFRQGTAIQFMFLTTPKGAYYKLDPFNSKK